MKGKRLLELQAGFHFTRGGGVGEEGKGKKTDGEMRENWENSLS